ncbi:AfsA-related hotdog domain-containing protein [Nocardia sp. NPDC051570]|uniref:AfsA-related hotdog domain-containing protein n=1 Tax=Nocardia sp. NPDC051570 TaxID=3364324 RepID=UPI0037937F25
MTNSQSEIQGVDDPYRDSTLVVDESDSFFFDHPLDHVPGMLLFSELLDLASSAEHAREESLPGRVRGEVRCTKICESDQPTTMRCVARESGWRTTATQGGYDVCVADFEFVRPAPMVCALGRIIAAVPAPAELVHRHRSSNILVGQAYPGPDGAPQAPVLTPPQGHPLRVAEPEYRTPVEIAEAARQFGIYLEHTEAGAPLDTRMLALSMTIDIPFRVPRSVPLLLRCTQHQNPTRRAISSIALIDAVTQTQLGTLTVISTNVSPGDYARMRATA